MELMAEVHGNTC